MKRTSIRLADGRELLYFDRSDDADRSAADTRELTPAAGSQLRHDRLLDEWVTYSPHRQDRTFLPADDRCPLCPSGPGNSTEIPAGDYEIVVLENRFPSFTEQVHGRCEVVCFTSRHDASFTSLSADRVRDVLEVLADRTAELSALPGVDQVFCFENRGREIGVTLQHPHGQIYAYPYVTPRTRRMLDSARAHRERTGGDLFAEILHEERTAGTRVVASNDAWTAFVPHAARWPYEVHIYPHRKVPDLAALADVERAAFAPLYLEVLAGFDALFGMPAPYVSGWHQAPVGADRDLAHLHLELFTVRRAPDKLKYLAGSESAMGAFVNDVLPEQAAARLREARHALVGG